MLPEIWNFYNISKKNLPKTFSFSSDFVFQFQVMCENLRAEKALMKESEVRLMQENKSLLEHQKSQNSLVTNLQTLQVS